MLFLFKKRTDALVEQSFFSTFALLKNL